MTAEARRILEVFKVRGLRAGDTIHPADFGEAIIWEAGRVRDEPVRAALRFLFDNGLLVEALAAFILTEKGERALGDATPPRHGARVYRVGGRVLVKQTVLRGTPPEYVVDGDREQHVAEDDDAAIANAVRAAIRGEL